MDNTNISYDGGPPKSVRLTVTEGKICINDGFYIFVTKNTPITRGANNDISDITITIASLQITINLQKKHGRKLTRRRLFPFRAFLGCHCFSAVSGAKNLLYIYI
jgi:hypothetical protein